MPRRPLVVGIPLLIVTASIGGQARRPYPDPKAIEPLIGERI